MSVLDGQYGCPCHLPPSGTFKGGGRQGSAELRQASLCCKSCRASGRDRYGILPRKAAGMQGMQGMVHVSVAVVQVDLQNGVRGQ